MVTRKVNHGDCSATCYYGKHHEENVKIVLRKGQAKAKSKKQDVIFLVLNVNDQMNNPQSTSPKRRKAQVPTKTNRLYQQPTPVWAHLKETESAILLSCSVHVVDVVYKLDPCTNATYVDATCTHSVVGLSGKKDTDRQWDAKSVMAFPLAHKW